MNILDVLLGIPLLWAIYKGFSKGLIVEVATLVALILGVYGALHFSELTAGFIREWLEYDSPYMGYISFVVTFLLIVLIVNLLGRLLDRVVEAIALGFVNRLLGVFFSVVKIALILSILVNLIDRLNDRFDFISQEKKERSFLYDPLNDMAETIYDLVDFDFGKAREDLKKQLEDESRESPVEELV